MRKIDWKLTLAQKIVLTFIALLILMLSTWVLPATFVILAVTGVGALLFIVQTLMILRDDPQ